MGRLFWNIILRSYIKKRRLRKTKKIYFCLQENRIVRRIKPKIEQYGKIIDRYSLDDFKSHFRLTRVSFEKLCSEISVTFFAEVKDGTSAGGRQHTDLQYQILVFLWTVSNQESFRGIADRFGVADGNAHEILIRISKIICANCHKFLKWPQEEDMPTIIEGFKDHKGKKSLQGVVGAIDCKHIHIPKPIIDPVSYYDRQGRYSVILQGICDGRLKFLDVFVGWPGASHDSAVFQASPIFQRLENERANMLHHTFLIGDAAYPLKTYLMKPYRDTGQLSNEQKTFNINLSSKRVKIEQAFGLLVNRFRRLKFLHIFNLKYLPAIVISCCILHNICVDQGDTIVENIEYGDTDTTNCSDNTSALFLPRNKLAEEIRNKLAKDFWQRQQH